MVIGANAVCGTAAEPRSDPTGSDVLPASQWEQVELAVERGLAWLATQQQRDGAYRSETRGQPGVTSLAVMAFLSAGHSPSEGPFANQLERAVTFALDCQQPSGLLAKHKTPRRVVRYNAGHTVFYNHGITGLMLGEMYGMSSAEQNALIRQAIPLAIDFLAQHQFNKPRSGDDGGWRYAYPHMGVHADMSCTAWQLSFLRSAKNAGFDVPEEIVDGAVAYVERCYDPHQRVFMYGVYGSERYPSGGAVGGAILSLSMAGRHDSEMAKNAARWLAARRFERYNSSMGPGNNYHYGAYYASQAFFQLGGDHWRKFYPRIVRALVRNQRANGSWPADAGIASPYGSVYSTSLAVLALTPPYQLVPVLQR